MKINDAIWLVGFVNNYAGIIPIIIVYFSVMGYVLFDMITSQNKKK